MVRWRLCLVLSMLLLLPERLVSKSLDEDEDDERSDEGDEDDEDEDEDEEDEPSSRLSKDFVSQRRIPPPPTPPRLLSLTSHVGPVGPDTIVTKTPKRHPLECYVCAYKSDNPLRACLDPTKFRVHTITCHSVDDKCFTSVVPKGDQYEAVVRGCRSGCVGSPETTCCEQNRCNNQAFAMPMIQPRVAPTPKPQPKPVVVKPRSKGSKTVPPNVFLFVTALLLLQTVVKVAFV